MDISNIPEPELNIFYETYTNNTDSILLEISLNTKRFITMYLLLIIIIIIT